MREGRADETPYSLGLTVCVFGKHEQVVVTALLRGNESTPLIYFAKLSSSVKQRKCFWRGEAIKLLV